MDWIFPGKPGQGRSRPVGHPIRLAGGSKKLFWLVGATGFEPMTPSLVRRAGAFVVLCDLRLVQ